jgi:metal-responsive CopG/Arc/MetJ family transcriptional regulator
MSEKESIPLEEDEALEEAQASIDLDRDKHIIVTTVAIPKDLLKQLGYIAVEEGVSRGEIIRRAIKDYLTSHNPKIGKGKEDYAEKVKKVIEQKKKLEDKGISVEIEDTELLPENIDKTLAEIEKALKEYED